jgi:hypothetical protein
MQSDDGIQAWKESFPKIYGPLLGLATENVLNTETDIFLGLLFGFMKKRGLMKPPSKRSDQSEIDEGTMNFMQGSTDKYDCFHFCE